MYFILPYRASCVSAIKMRNQDMRTLVVIILVYLFNCACGQSVRIVNVTENVGPSLIYDLQIQDSEGIAHYDLYSLSATARAVINEYFTYSQGRIEALKTIDRDDIAKRIGESYEPVVITFDYLLFSGTEIRVILSIIDQDDNDPTFDTNTERVVISEGEIDTEPIGQAMDDDEGTNAITNYTLVDDLDGLFRLDIRRNTMGDILGLKLENTLPLDYEMQTEYTLQLVAIEGSADPQTATRTLNVTVQDTCDSFPFFPMTRYFPHAIPENSTIGTVVFDNLTAYDVDSVDIEDLTYHIDEVCRRQEVDSPHCQSVDDQHPFMLDQEQGILTLDGEIDREEFALYEISVHAVDNCAHSTSATVVVTIEDINDNCPEISFEFSVIGGEIKETITNLPISVGFVEVEDDDDGSNGMFSVSLFEVVDGAQVLSDTFRLNHRLELDLIQRVDREARSEYQLMIVATDNGSPQCTSTYPVLITVEDSNDNSPVILRDNLQPVYEIDEELPVNFEIVNINATDADDIATGNGMVTFHLPVADSTFPFQHLFAIESTTGILKVADRIDRELYENLQVLVVASDNPMLVSTRRDQVLNDSVIINITLRDINDNRPVIHHPTGTIEVREDHRPATLLFLVNATDLDRTPSFSTLRYSMLPSDTPFRMNSDNGKVFLQEEMLDYETVEEYTVRIIVSDGSSHASTEEVLIISVININDEPPEFEASSESIVVNIRESMHLTGIHVATVNATDPDMMDDDLRFEIVSGNDRGHFNIDEVSGRITTALPLNKEDVANYTLIISADDGELDSIRNAVVIVNVLDINDNPPEFINEPYNFQVEEEGQPQTSVTPIHGTTEIRAIDLDTGVNEQITYAITGSTPNVAEEWFTIDSETGVITTKRRLDRENSALGPDGIVRLTVQARNPPVDGQNPLIDEAEVRIAILDINDQYPFFEQPNRTISLSENFEIGLTFLTVQAIDRDQSPNNETTYELVPDPPNIADFISIHTTSGKLQFRDQLLNHESEVVVAFSVRAFDAIERIRYAEQDIIINVIDAVDTCLQLVNFDTQKNLEENSPPDTTVLIFEARNDDNQFVDTVEYTLMNQDGTQSTEFAITENAQRQARIHTIAMNIDRETLAEYALTITAHDTDSSLECVTRSGVLTVTITDENDNPPVFSSNQYEFSITERNRIGAPVGTVQATDMDEGNNSRISYSIIGDTVPFMINNFGEITATEVLDRDPPTGVAQYTFIVTAEDHGVVVMDSSTSVTVTVVDVNDNDPVFDRNQNLTFVVPEDAEVNEVIATIRVTDNDSGSYGQVTVTINQGSQLDQHFELRPDGAIVLLQSLDRETEPDYSFEVRAVDGGGRRNIELISIVVSDINDNPPIFGLEPFEAVDVFENVPPGYSITQVTATDADEGRNAKIMFELEDKSYDGTFRLESDTGILFVKASSTDCDPPESYLPVRPLDYERETSYTLTILAYDETSPRHFDSRTVNINILDHNEHAPMFDSNSVEVTVDEDLEIDEIVLRIKAYDWDFDTLTYSVLEDGEQSVNFRYQGDAIVTQTRMNYDDRQLYELTLRAQESITSEQNSATTIVKVYVRNVNDHKPIFVISDIYPTSEGILESTDLNRIILTVHADDADNATHDAVSYQIMSGNEGNVFRIDSQTGDLIVQSHLDYDSVQSYTLTVVATDTGQPTRTSTAHQLRITVENINDESPIFTSDTYRFEYMENSPIGTTVGQVQAPDRDHDPYGTVEYSLLNGDNGFFEVDSMTGYVRSLVIIDREELARPDKRFWVLATDSGSSPLTDTAEVIVLILDANDNRPQFSQYQYYIPEHDTQRLELLEPGVTILDLADKVTDEDLDENAALTFELVSQISGNLLDVTSSGLVSLNASPQNGVQIYEAEVSVYNTNDPSLFDRAFVRVLIEGNNDHHPRFGQEGGYSVTVREDAMRESVIFDASLHVSDRDTGPNGELSYDFQELYAQFSINRTTGHITLKEQLDFEEVELYFLRVAAIDSTGRTAETSLTVTVTSVNDNHPVFDEFPARLVLSPIPEANIDLFSLSASDDDKGSDGIVRYTLSENGIVSASFSIDPELGVVRSKGPVVSGGSYNLTITAYDNGSPPESQDAMILVVVIEPSTAPMFIGVSNPHVLNEDENRAEGSLYSYVTEPQGASFSLVYTDAPTGLFSVSKSQGLLFLQGTLDYLTEQSYTLIIEAYFEDNNDLQNIIRQSSYLDIIINVMDVNNNDPRFVPPTFTTSLSEDAESGTFIYQAQALDDDTGIFGSLNYVISNGDTERVFAINKTSGEVTLRGSLDREGDSSYKLTIRAFDLSINPKHGEMTLHINVMDVNDYVPRFLPEGNRSIGVYEYPHTSGGAQIIKLAATDLDVGPPLIYELLLEEAKFRERAVTVSNPFEIGFNSGMISLRESVELDFESTDYYLLRVQATDTVTSVTTYLEVNVLDVNDHSPEILDTVRLQTDQVVWEQQLQDSQVTRIRSGDSDQGVNGVLTYSLGEEWEREAEGVFVIDPHTGVVRVRTSPVAPISSFEATVYVTDQGIPPKNASTLVSVRVDDVNNKPEFDSEAYVFRLPVEASIGKSVGEFKIADSDLKENFGIEVRIPRYYDEANGLFQVSLELEPVTKKYNGSINFQPMAGKELKAQNYSFRLEADNPSFSPACAPFRQVSYVDVTVIVYPRCPEFSQPTYSIEVVEEQYPYNVLEQFVATSSVGRQVKYSIRDGDVLPFTIDRNSGELTLTSALDREDRNNYTFEVSATDSIYQPLTCSASVEVTVLDINDNSPSFLPVESLSVPENSGVQVSVGNVKATDDDQEDSINSEIYYELAELATVPFTIDRLSGEIYSTEEFDAETIETYTFEVRALDGGNPQLTGSVSVTVTIDDVNEYEPSFPRTLYNTFPPVRPGTHLGAVVGTVTAEDRDKRPQLRYYFSNDPPKQYFEINSVTGVITLIATPVDSSSTITKRSIQKRQTDNSDEYFTVHAEINATDGFSNATTKAEFSLHTSFMEVPPIAGIDSTTMIIIVVVVSVVAVIGIFLCLLIICLCSRSRRKDVKIKDSTANSESVELQRFNSRRSQGSRSSTPGQQHRYTTNTNIYSGQGHTIHHSSGSGSNSSRQSYCNSADDELDSNNGDILKRSAYNSPGLIKRQSNVSHGVHARSTSDLASSVGTDLLGSQQLPHPKAKIDAIYAAHQELLNNHGSRESIHSNHTFASEGGGEADAEDDIHAMLTSKYEFEDDDDDVTTLPDDTSYIGKDPHLPDSTVNLDIPPVEEDHLPRYPYSQPTENEWAPRGTSMDQTINGIHEMAGYSSSQDHHIPMSRYREPSQPASMYGASSQGSRTSLLRHHGHHAPRMYDLPPHMGQPPPTYDYDYYHHPQEPRQSRDRSHPRSYGSASALQDYGIPRDYPPPREPRPDHRHHLPRGPPVHMMFSQEVPPTYPYIPHGQTPSSATPTDGTVTPSRVMGQEEYEHGEYMSSSSTSLGSTNLSGTTSSIGASASQRIYHK